MKMKPTRRYPTPLGYHFEHPGLSLFERSLKPRRPRTPDKSNNGLIISRSIVPTNIILDASILDDIIENDDDRYRPLINQIRPLLRSHYNYYNERMRNMNRIHAYFDLNIMIPAYKRNRQQIEKHIQELRKVEKN